MEEFESIDKGMCDAYEHRNQLHVEQSWCHNFEALYRKRTDRELSLHTCTVDEDNYCDECGLTV